MIMDSYFSIFSSIYNFFSRHKVLLYSATFVIILLAALVLKNITMNEDIAPLLPDDRMGLSYLYRYAHTVVS